MMTYMLAVAGALMLGRCGGGGGSSTSIAPVVAAAVQRPDLLMFYFGCVADQLKEVADHVNVAMLAGWSHWTTANRTDNLIAEAVDAVALGYTKLILMVDWLLFDAQWKFKGPAELQALQARLVALRIWQHVLAIYPVDEPELHGLDTPTLNAINLILRQFGKPLMVIYTDRHQWPGFESFDWVSFDKYDASVGGGGLLDSMRLQLRPEQRYFLTVGGADPYRNPPEPALEVANGDPRCLGICAFLWGRYEGGAGIRDNGMAERYRVVGAKISRAP